MTAVYFHQTLWMKYGRFETSRWNNIYFFSTGYLIFICIIFLHANLRLEYIYQQDDKARDNYKVDEGPPKHKIWQHSGKLFRDATCCSWNVPLPRLLYTQAHTSVFLIIYSIYIPNWSAFLPPRSTSNFVINWL